VPTLAAVESSITQVVSFSSLSSADLFTGELRQVIEDGYALSIGIATLVDGVAVYCEGCSLNTVASGDTTSTGGVRRLLQEADEGVFVTFVVTLPTAERLNAASAASSALDEGILTTAMETVAAGGSRVPLVSAIEDPSVVGTDNAFEMYVNKTNGGYMNSSKVMKRNRVHRRRSNNYGVKSVKMPRNMTQLSNRTLQRVTSSLAYVNQLVGRPYGAWNSGSLPASAPMWASNKEAPMIDHVKNGSLSCVGIPNLMLRKIGGKIPCLKMMASGCGHCCGGTGAYYQVFGRERKHRFDINKNYPKGTLVGSPYRNVNDQGHTAVLLGSGKNSMLLHSDRASGVTSNMTLEEAYNTLSWCRFTYAVVPQEWLQPVYSRNSSSMHKRPYAGRNNSTSNYTAGKKSNYTSGKNSTMSNYTAGKKSNYTSGKNSTMAKKPKKNKPMPKRPPPPPQAPVHRRRAMQSRRRAPKKNMPKRGAFSNPSPPAAADTTTASARPAASKPKKKFRMQQRIAFETITSPETYTGTIKRVAEIGYAVSIGIHDTIQFCEGCSVTSVASIFRRNGVAVAFESEMPEDRLEVAEAESASLADEPDTLTFAMEDVAEAEGDDDLVIPTVGAIEVPVSEEVEEEVDCLDKKKDGPIPLPILLGTVSVFCILVCLLAYFCFCRGSSQVISEGITRDIELGTIKTIKTSQAGIDKINNILTSATFEAQVPPGFIAGSGFCGATQQQVGALPEMGSVTMTIGPMSPPPQYHETARGVAAARRDRRIPVPVSPAHQTAKEFDRKRREEEYNMDVKQKKAQNEEQKKRLVKLGMWTAGSKGAVSPSPPKSPVKKAFR